MKDPVITEDLRMLLQDLQRIQQAYPEVLSEYARVSHPLKDAIRAVKVCLEEISR